MTLTVIRAEPCTNDRESWCRVWSYRGDKVMVSELSWTLARRIVPKLLSRHGIQDVSGWCWGRSFVVRK
jgi:hypothetical protein